MKWHPDSQDSDQTNFLWFSKAASVCVHWLEFVKLYQKCPSTESSSTQSQHCSTNKQDQEPHHFFVIIFKSVGTFTASILSTHAQKHPANAWGDAQSWTPTHIHTHTCMHRCILLKSKALRISQSKGLFFKNVNLSKVLYTLQTVFKD